VILCILGVGWGFYWVLFYYGGYFVYWVFVGGFLCILGFLWVLGVVGVSFGFSWLFHVYLVSLAKLLLCILPVYLRAPYAFLMKFSYLKKKMMMFPLFTIGQFPL
jgi:hypothetical protein